MKRWLLQGVVEEKIFNCRYERDYSQRHLQKSRLNQAMRGGGVRGITDREEGQERIGPKGAKS